MARSGPSCQYEVLIESDNEAFEMDESAITSEVVASTHEGPDTKQAVPRRLNGSDIHQAVNERNLEALSRLLATQLEDTQERWTPLQAAVREGWTEGVQLLLNAGASVTARIPLPEQPTVLHLAASLGGSDILDQLLARTRAKAMVNELNCNGETALFEAVASKNVASVTSLLQAGSDVTIVSRKKGTVLHTATLSNEAEIVEALFSATGTDVIKDATWNKPPGMKSATPLHLAAHSGNVDIVRILIEKGCDIRAKMDFYENKGFTPLHMAVYVDKTKVVEALLKRELSLGDEVSFEGWTPVQIAWDFGFEDCARLLLFAESDLSANVPRADGKSSTNMDLLLSRMPFSVDFLTRTFDLSITYRKPEESGKRLSRLIDINYAVLSPPRSSAFQRLHVVESLLRSGDHLNQHNLFLHPLIESYLYLQWKAMSLFYYILLLSYTIFAFVLSSHVIGIYYLQGSHRYPSWFCRCLAASIVLVWYYEGSHTILAFRESVEICCSGQTCRFLKSSVVFLFSLLKLVWVFILILLIYSVPFPPEVATSSLLLFWFRLMFLVSNIPHYGYYLLMFFEVASNFLKVLLSFSGIIGAFVAAFYLELGGRPPFNSTSEGIVKTVVMMTSEFDYSNMFVGFQGESLYSALFKRIIFVMFVLLVSMVIVNILIAKAITDVRTVDRIKKQAEFLIRFERVIDQTDVFCVWLAKWTKCTSVFCVWLAKWTKCTSVFLLGNSQGRPSVTISIGEDWTQEAHFPRDLRLKLLEVAHQNKRSEKS